MMSTGAEVLGATIRIVAYDPRWPEMFQHEADKIRAALEPRALLRRKLGMGHWELPNHPSIQVC